MTLQRREPATPSGAGSAVPQRSDAACVREAWALLQQWELGADDVEVRVHALRDTAGFTAGAALLTISNRRERGCRTYLCQPHVPGWQREFEQDLVAGVFGGTPPGPEGESLQPYSPFVHPSFSKGALS